MASRVRILPTVDENSVLSSSRLLVSCPRWRNSNEHRVALLIPLDTSLKKVEAPSQHYHDTKHCILRSPEHEPTLARAINRFHRGASGDERVGKDIEAHMNSVFLLSNPNTLLSTFYPNYNHSTAFAQYPCVDACFSGLFTSHGQHAITQVTGATPKRIPLPLDVAEDEPVYVNAKQYHGILRRRQHRAKLEMQNKLVKSRKPYLHESRHLHALNRVRGSGGRFLSKKLQQPEPTSKNSHCLLDRKNRSELESCRLHTVGHGCSSTSCSDISSISNNDGDFQ